jgi:LCP family protein required for cell wall assembly
LQPIKGRYNILLLGGDAGSDRFGLRPDSISVLSIDANTGATVNIGIPRNMQHVKFGKDSPMTTVYPNGWNCGVECLINAIYKDTMDNHQDLYPNAIKQGSDPGVEATKDAVQWVTGLQIQAYVLVDMAGFKNLINALGGIEINVKERLPIGGGEDIYGNPINVRGWIEPGLQHMDGKHALWYARARHGSNDYKRMQRQREVENAMLQQLEPANVLSRFNEIAKAGKSLVRTNIPSDMVSTFVDLALKAKKVGITPLEIVPPKFNMIHPEFSAIRRIIKNAVTPKATPTPSK